MKFEQKKHQHRYKAHSIKRTLQAPTNDPDGWLGVDKFTILKKLSVFLLASFICTAQNVQVT